MLSVSPIYAAIDPEGSSSKTTVMRSAVDYPFNYEMGMATNFTTTIYPVLSVKARVKAINAAFAFDGPPT